jgi:hypothetical protein
MTLPDSRRRGRGALRLEPPTDWSDMLRREFAVNQFNGCIGQLLVSETTRVRVWSIRLKPGERLGFHRHVLDYFWTAVTDGSSVSRFHDGRVMETAYRAGDTKHFRFGPEEFMIHDLTNIGTDPLIFTTVEFMDSANPPLPVPDHVRVRPDLQPAQLL